MQKIDKKELKKIVKITAPCYICDNQQAEYEVEVTPEENRILFFACFMCSPKEVLWI